MIRKSALAALAFVGAGIPNLSVAAADEVIVTAMRREADDYAADRPAVGLAKRADFAVQPVTISGDTRDREQRASEIYAMLGNAVTQAERDGLALGYGDSMVIPLTRANLGQLLLKNGNRPDTQQVTILVKVPLTGGIEGQGVEKRVAAFLKAVKPVGRALIEADGELTLSVVDPDQYRPSITAAIAADARAAAGSFGPDYAVEAEGLNHRVEWARDGLTGVFLYIPYKLTVVSKR